MEEPKKDDAPRVLPGRLLLGRLAVAGHYRPGVLGDLAELRPYREAESGPRAVDHPNESNGRK